MQISTEPPALPLHLFLPCTKEKTLHLARYTRVLREYSYLNLMANLVQVLAILLKL